MTPIYLLREYLIRPEQQTISGCWLRKITKGTSYQILITKARSLACLFYHFQVNDFWCIVNSLTARKLFHSIGILLFSKHRVNG